MYFPSFIYELIKDKKCIKINDYTRSKDIIYQIDNDYILKISKNHELLLNEKNINDFLIDKLPVCKSCYFIREGKYSYYLKTMINGEPLCSDKYLNNPDLLIKLLKSAVFMFHNIKINGETLIHGDFCLPNILAHDDKIVGFIDLGLSRIGDVWEDYAWSIWSLEYNLKSNEYTNKYLDLLGIVYDKEKYNYYIKF